MDPSQATSSGWTLDDSPPYVSNDLSSDSGSSPGSSSFDQFINYNAFNDSSPCVGAFGALSLNAPHGSETFPTSPHGSPQPYPTSYAESLSISQSVAGRPLASYEGQRLALSPTLTLSPGYGMSGPGGLYHPASPNDGIDRGQLLESRHISPSPLLSCTSTGHAGGASERNSMDLRQMLTQEDGEGLVDPGNIVMEGSSKGPQRYSRASRIARIEAEQKRRDETKAAYARLKNALPVSAQKNSKAILLDRAISYIRQLEESRTALQSQFAGMERELEREKRQNETLVQTLTDSSNRHLSAISAPGPSTLASVESNTPGKPPSPNES